MVGGLAGSGEIWQDLLRALSLEAERFLSKVDFRFSFDWSVLSSFLYDLV